MSTICKLDPEVRKRRANLLRNPPPAPKKPGDRALYGAVMAELFMIHRSSRLTGDTKHRLFERGAKQLAQLQ